MGGRLPRSSAARRPRCRGLYAPGAAPLLTNRRFRGRCEWEETEARPTCRAAWLEGDVLLAPRLLGRACQRVLTCAPAIVEPAKRALGWKKTTPRPSAARRFGRGSFGRPRAIYVRALRARAGGGRGCAPPRVFFIHRRRVAGRTCPRVSAREVRRAHRSWGAPGPLAPRRLSPGFCRGGRLEEAELLRTFNAWYSAWSWWPAPPEAA